jgi:bacillithiol synthase
LAAEKREMKQSYLAGEPDLMAFAAWPYPLKDFMPLIHARSKTPVPRTELAAELITQNQHLPESEAVLANIHKLKSECTFTVTTGHQVCLMGGPLFTLFKIATTIALARELKEKHPENDFVPVLWMATEDHDWEEVNHFYRNFNEKTVYPGSFQGPVGRHLMEPSIEEVLPQSLPASIRSFYRPGTTLAEAFRSLMHHLFGRDGLVVLDADRPALKKLFAPKMARELQGTGMANAVRTATQHLEDLGFKAQIFPRDINLFYIGDGGRSLIDRVEGEYKLKQDKSQKGGQSIQSNQQEAQRSWTQESILEELDQYPENFSPNVALRPVYQETLLPTVAFVGGWAEISYWLQLKAGFAALETPFPLLVPRMHATLFTASQAQELKSLGLPLSTISLPLHLINDLYLKQHWDEEPLGHAIEQVDQAFEKLAAMVNELDPTLAAGVRAEQARSNNAFESLQKKVKKSLRNRTPQPYQHIAALKNAIEPENQPQQRTLNFTAFDSVDPLTLVAVLLEQARHAKSEAQWITLP